MELSITISKGAKSRTKPLTEEVYQVDPTNDEELILKVLRRHKSRDTTGWSVTKKRKVIREMDGTFLRYQEIEIEKRKA